MAKFSEAASPPISGSVFCDKLVAETVNLITVEAAATLCRCVAEGTASLWLDPIVKILRS
jgi:hypothetical protein